MVNDVSIADHIKRSLVGGAITSLVFCAVSLFISLWLVKVVNALDPTGITHLRSINIYLNVIPLAFLYSSPFYLVRFLTNCKRPILAFVIPVVFSLPLFFWFVIFAASNNAHVEMVFMIVVVSLFLAWHTIFSILGWVMTGIFYWYDK